MDDDAAIRTVVRWQLDDAGFRVVEADDGASALRRIRDDHPALVVLDLSLPRLGGLDVLRSVRGGQAGRSDTPMIVLSGRSGETDPTSVPKTNLVKPFSPGELAARVRSVLRRTTQEMSSEAIVVGTLRIEPSSRRVLRVEGSEEREVELTPKEFGLLDFLAMHPRHAAPHGAWLLGIGWWTAHDHRTAPWRHGRTPRPSPRRGTRATW